MKIIPELDEAYYGFYAITHTTEIANGVSVDIGGGSTEVTLFKDKELVESHSFPFGVVTLTRMFLKIKHTTTNQLLKIWKNSSLHNLMNYLGYKIKSSPCRCGWFCTKRGSYSSIGTLISNWWRT